MALFKQCVALFFIGILVDLTQTIHIQACGDRKLLTAVWTVIAIYTIGFWGHDWFVNHKTAFARWMLTLSGAIGAGVGTGLVILLGG